MKLNYYLTCPVMSALTHASCRSKQPHQTSIRRLHLLHEIFTKDSNKYLTKIKKMSIRPPYKVLLNILGPRGSDLGQMTLQSAFSLIEPLNYLAAVHTKSDLPYFQIKPLKPLQDLPENQPVSKKQLKRAGHGVEFHLTTDTPATYLPHVLNKACQNLLQGNRIQFALHQRRSKGVLPTPIAIALKNCPHLRPDTILRAMPEGTTILAQPCIFPESKARKGKRANLEPPLLWIIEHQPSLVSAGLSTPGWVRAMAQWNGELMLDPNVTGRQSIKDIWAYSEEQRTGLKRKDGTKKKASKKSQAQDPVPSDSPEARQSMTLDQLVP